jgi:hypothetical protein
LLKIQRAIEVHSGHDVLELRVVYSALEIFLALGLDLSLESILDGVDGCGFGVLLDRVGFGF